MWPGLRAIGCPPPPYAGKVTASDSLDTGPPSMTLTNRRLYNGLLLQVICWLCFFLVPAINAQGAVDGHWLRLCTSAGVVIVASETGELPGEHTDDRCPCIQYSAGLPALPIPLETPEPLPLVPASPQAFPAEATFSNYLARGPPYRPALAGRRQTPHIEKDPS